MKEIFVTLIYGAIMFISGYSWNRFDHIDEINMYKQQIALRDTTNAENIRIHTLDTLRIHYLLTHDRK